MFVDELRSAPLTKVDFWNDPCGGINAAAELRPSPVEFKQIADKTVELLQQEQRLFMSYVSTSRFHNFI